LFQSLERAWTLQNSSLKVGSLIWFYLKWLKIRESDDKICLFEKVGSGARSENNHTYKVLIKLLVSTTHNSPCNEDKCIHNAFMIRLDFCNCYTCSRHIWVSRHY
ncbi:hypothetical protein AABB24_020339, partial [Solanum stoloniferum]